LNVVYSYQNPLVNVVNWTGEVVIVAVRFFETL